jgi:hypothetical protein
MEVRFISTALHFAHFGIGTSALPATVLGLKLNSLQF